MAEKYWVGGTGTWNQNSGGRWSLTSGGAGGAGIPNTGDNVHFDANSGGGIVTIAAGAACYNFIATGYTGQLKGSTNFNFTISGVAVYLTGSTSGGLNFYGGPNIIFNNGSGVSLYPQGSSIATDITINSGVAVTLQGHLVTKLNNQITNNGTLNCNGYDLVVGLYYGPSGSVINMSSGTVYAIQAGAMAAPTSTWQIASSTGVSAGSSTLRFQPSQGAGCLSSALTSSSTSFTLIDAFLTATPTYWPSSGIVLIENEFISYSSISSPTGTNNITFSGLTRGLYYSTPASHAQYKPVVFIGPRNSTLSSSCTSSDTTLNVTDTTNFGANGGYIEVDGEVMTYTAKTATTLTGVTRGLGTYGGTAAAAHASGTIVRFMQNRNIYLGASATYNIIEYGTNGEYLICNMFDAANITTFRACPYLPANPINGINYIQCGSPNITNFLLGGTRGIQGVPAVPVWINATSLPGVNKQNTSTVVFTNNYPSFPYVYKGGDDFIF